LERNDSSKTNIFDKYTNFFLLIRLLWRFWNFIITHSCKFMTL
jgi:hypothetical protein